MLNDPTTPRTCSVVVRPDASSVRSLEPSARTSVRQPKLILGLQTAPASTSDAEKKGKIYEVIILQSYCDGSKLLSMHVAANGSREAELIAGVMIRVD